MLQCVLIFLAGLVAMATATLHAQQMNGFDLRGASIPAQNIHADSFGLPAPTPG
jgi:hypothetical protein